MHIEKTLMELNIYLFLIKDYELLEKYNEIWEKVKNNLKKEFDSEPVYNEKYLKAKLISYYEETHTGFHDNEIPKEGSQLVCLSVILFTELVKTIILKCF